jgi:hypothetical protein
MRQYSLSGLPSARSPGTVLDSRTRTSGPMNSGRSRKYSSTSPATARAPGGGPPRRCAPRAASPALALRRQRVELLAELRHRDEPLACWSRKLSATSSSLARRSRAPAASRALNSQGLDARSARTCCSTYSRRASGSSTRRTANSRTRSSSGSARRLRLGQLDLPHAKLVMARPRLRPFVATVRPRPSSLRTRTRPGRHSRSISQRMLRCCGVVLIFAPSLFSRLRACQA